MNLYAATKQAFTDIIRYYVELHSLTVLNLELCDVYGHLDPRMKLLNLLKAHARTGDPLKMTPGEQLINLVHIDDVASAFHIAVNHIHEYSGNLRFNVRSQTSVSVRQLVEYINAILPNPLNVQWDQRPYRPREMFSPWIEGEILPHWSATIPFEQGLRDFFEREST